MIDDFVYFGNEARGEIEHHVENARLLVKPFGIDVTGGRFPFAMHHSAYRNRLPRINGSLLTHFRIAGFLNTWAMERGSPHDYVWQAVYGAMIEGKGGLHENHLPEPLKLKLLSIGFGADFEGWASSKLKNRA